MSVQEPQLYDAYGPEEEDTQPCLPPKCWDCDLFDSEEARMCCSSTGAGWVCFGEHEESLLNGPGRKP